MRKLDEVTIEIIQKCFSECIFCSSLSSIDSHNQIPFSKIVDIISFCKEKGAHSICISGGEPLLHPDIADVLHYIDNCQLNAVLYTSGNVARVSKRISLISNSLQSNRLKFIVNYPSHDNKIYQQLINSNNFKISDLDNFLQLLMAFNIDVEVHLVPNRLNIDNLYATLLHLKNLGIKKASLLRMVYQGRAKLNRDELFINDTRALGDVINKIISELCNNNFSVRLGVPFKKHTTQKIDCLAGVNKLIFRYDGVVFPCEAFKEAPDNEHYKLGDIYLDNLNDIWDNVKVHKEIETLKSNALFKHESCPAQLLYSI